jgi:oxygen-independent coproporphyrinogen III oxidase
VLSTGIIIDSNLFRKYRGARRRYAMYPPARRMDHNFDAAAYRRWLQNRGEGGFNPPLALYLHLEPGVHGSHGRAGSNGEAGPAAWTERGQSARYVDHLAGELRLIAGNLADRPCARTCWAGDNFASLGERELAELMSVLRSQFALDPAGDYAVELGPGPVGEERIALLASLGMNRIGLGTRASNPGVSDRTVSSRDVEATGRAVLAARKYGFQSVNVDLVYGLPDQGAGTLPGMLAQILACTPDGVSLRPAQVGKARPAFLLGPEATLEIVIDAVAQLQAAGYVYVGMDQFARLPDASAPAQRQARPARALGGYGSDGDCDLASLGVSAVSKVGPTYCQNLDDSVAYCAEIDAGRLPVARGILLGADDLARRAVIEALACRFEVSMESIGIGHLIDFKRYFAEELTVLEGFARDGLIELDSEWITVTPRGKWLVCAVCEVFDRYR